jgi:aminopeptidase N
MPQAMGIFEKRFGPYPFEKYGMAEVEPFYVGGMEHQTMTTVNSLWIRGDRSYEAGFVHELAHMWWGDAVTLADWPDIWLNEGFATYSEALYAEDAYGPAAFREKMRGSRKYYFDQALTMDFALYDPPPNQLFNWGIVYNKGAWVLHLLRRAAGDGAFWQILSSYYRAYAYTNAATADFQSVCEAVTGQDLDWFFNQWVYGNGYPELSWSGTFLHELSGRIETRIRVDQTQKSGTVFRLPLDIRFAGVKDTSVWLDRVSATFVLRSDRKPDSVILDPDGWALARIRNVPTPVQGADGAPAQAALYPNYPNPFNAETAVRYDVPGSAGVQDVVIAVYNLLGEPVRTLVRETRPMPGQYRVVWDGTDGKGAKVPSGLYVVQMRAGPTVREQKAAVLR